MNVAVMTHHLRFAPTLSPIRPSEEPTRNERSDVRACWSGLWNRSSEVANSRATARLNWTRLPAVTGRRTRERQYLLTIPELRSETHSGNLPRCNMPERLGRR